MAIDNSLVVLVATCLASVALYGFLPNRHIRHRLPPGPKGYPLVGNAFGTPHTFRWLAYADWAEQYGEISSYTIFGQTTIVLNSLKAATELLEKRSANYSDRPRMVMANDLMGWGWDFVHMHYGDRWRQHRRLFHQYFQSRNLANYHPIQTKITVNMLEQLGRSPERYADHFRQLAGAVVLRTAYGYDVKQENDFYVQLAHKAVLPLLEVVHANFLVEYLPFLKHIPAWMPGANFKRWAETTRQYATDTLEIPFQNTKNEMENGRGQQSFVVDNLQKMKSDSVSGTIDEEEIIKNCAGIMYIGEYLQAETRWRKLTIVYLFIAGTDTTSVLLLVWQLAMLQFPDVQQRAHAEVDSIVGKARLPDFNDRPLMPYVEAMILETLRWHSVTPLSVPHRVMEDDEYEGYYIPAGSTIISNVWNILHDPELYPEPFEFKPERFLDDQGKVSFERQPDPSIAGAFGFGRRICPGRLLAMDTSWIAIVHILACYNLSKFVDDEGNTVEPAIAFKDGLVSHPEPYKIKYTPRLAGLEKLLESAKSVLA